MERLTAGRSNVDPVSRDEHLQQITSNDGAVIACWSTGQGPPLVLVHGGISTHARWASVLPTFSRGFTVYTIDRRGRGGSGDGDDYAIEREFEDVAAVVDALPAPVDLLGHSYGALCALEAALRTTQIRRLILYEPPVLLGTEVFPPTLIDRMQTLADAGDREGLALIWVSEVGKNSPQEIARMRASPIWQMRLAAAPTIPRELRAVQAYVFEPARFRTIQIPTLLLLGTESPAYLKSATEAVAAALRHARVVVLPGQGHRAMETAPDLLASEVMRFLGNT